MYSPIKQDKKSNSSEKDNDEIPIFVSSDQYSFNVEDFKSSRLNLESFTSEKNIMDFLSQRKFLISFQKSKVKNFSLKCSSQVRDEIMENELAFAKEMVEITHRPY